MASTDTTTRNDLDWLAFCYVAGELSAAESLAFEDRLAWDEAACEAVALAAKLNLAVVAACDRNRSGSAAPAIHEVDVTIPAHRDGFAATSRWAGTAITAAAASAIVAAGIAMSIGPAFFNDGRVTKREGTDRLVAAWAAGEAVRNGLDDDGDLLDASDDADLDPPDWLLAAITAEHQADLLPNDDDHEVREN